MKDWETIRDFKQLIENYEHPDDKYMEGVIMGLTYALTYLEHGKEYADQKVDIPLKPCGCCDGKEDRC